MEIIYKVKLLILSVLLVSCSSKMENRNVSKLVDLYKEMTKPVVLKTYTREMFENIDYPLIEVRTDNIIKQALMIPLTQRNGYYNYSSGSGQSITMHGAMVVKTNGFETYLLSNQIESGPFLIKTPLKNWPQVSSREYSFLKPDNSIETITFECKLNFVDLEEIVIVDKKHQTMQITENCKSKFEDFVNTYWVDEKGFVWKSKQWVSTKDIYMEIFILKTS